MLSRLRTSIILTVIIGLLIPVSVGSVLTLEQRRDSLTQAMRADHERLTHILALGMQEPLWNIDPEGGLPLLESLAGDPRIVAISVRDQRGRDFLMRQFPDRRHGRSFVLEQPVVFHDQPIGRARIEMDSGPLDNAIAGERRLLAWTVFGQLSLSLVLIVLLLQQRMLRPIGRLMEESAQLARGELGRPFRWTQKDELGRLGASLEHTRQALQALFSEIEQKNHLLEQELHQREQTERELQRHRHHLEELVRERTQELQSAKERADAANEAKSRFLSNMTHELRTPLNAILGYAQVLSMSRTLEVGQAAGLATIRQSGEYLLALINDLLDLSKIEAGKFDPNPIPIALQPMLSELADIIRIRAAQKSLRFVYQLSTELPARVEVDDKRVRQVLLNLLGNAVKFTDSGEVALVVGARPDGPGRVRLRFDVRDTGVGLSPDEIERSFEPFEQVGDPRRRAGGTGLGLSISRQLVRSLGGEIEVESEPGRGSCFHFEISVPELAEPPALAAPDDRLAPRVTGYRGPRRRVLVVDPDAAQRGLLRDLLAPLGFAVDLAADGVEGLRRAATHPPDLVLIDIMVPTLEGLDAARRLRLDRRLEHVKIIVLAASTVRDAQQSSLLAGADGFLPKPVSPRELVERMAGLLGLSLQTAPPDHADDARLVAPPPAEMAALAEIAREGDMRLIRHRADHIETLDDRYKAFADRLRQLAGAYRSNEIIDFVERYASPHRQL